MLHIRKLLPRGEGLATVLLRRAAQVELDWDVRQRSRFDAVDSMGRALGVFLPRGTVVRDGDVLVAEDGSLITVRAAPQPVMVVRQDAEHGSPFDLMRAAYHLGNRHVQLQLAVDALKLEPDHVLADMLRQMHLVVSEAIEAFDPEGGAYAPAGHAHAHGHGHEHRDGHDHGHEHRHEHGTPAAAGTHVHGPDCGRAHDGHTPAAHATPQAHVHGPACGHDHGHDDVH